MKTTGNTILITGGGSGIGAALAHAFHTLGNHVIITGRREDKLGGIVHAHPGMLGYPLDVRDLPALAAFAATLAETHPQLNVVINNAGIMRAEDLRQGGAALDAFDDMLQTNVMAPVRLTGALLVLTCMLAACAGVKVSSVGPRDYIAARRADILGTGHRAPQCRCRYSPAYCRMGGAPLRQRVRRLPHCTGHDAGTAARTAAVGPG